MPSQVYLLSKLMEYKKKDEKNKADSHLSVIGACWGIALFYGYCRAIKNLALYENLEKAVSEWDGKTFPVLEIEKYFEFLETLQYKQDHIFSSTFFDAVGKINDLRADDQRPIRSEFKDGFLYPKEYAKSLLHNYLSININKLCILTSGKHAIWVSSEFRNGKIVYLVMDPNVGLVTDANGVKVPQETTDFNAYFNYVMQQLLLLKDSNIPELIPLTLHVYDLDDIYVPRPTQFDMNKFHQDAINVLSSVDQVGNKNYPDGINSRNEYSALDLACQVNDKKAVTLLLQNGADPNNYFIDDNGNIEICLANSVLDGFSEIVDTLLDYGADITLNDGKQNNFHIAVRNDKNATYQILLKHNFLRSALGLPSISLLDLTSDHENLLHLAAESGNTEIAKELIAANMFDLRAQTKNNDSALGLAIGNRHVEIIELLLKRDETLIFQHENGFSMLELAVYYNLPSVVDLILKIMSKHNVTTLKDIKALKFAIDNNEKIFTLLEKTKKFNVHIKFKDNLNTLLHFAAEKGSNHIVELLVGLNMDVNEINAKGETPISLAAKNGHAEIFISLLEAGAYIKSDSLSKIVYECAINNYTSMLNVILKDEIFSEKIRNSALVTALCFAIYRNNEHDNLDTLLCYVNKQNLNDVLCLKNYAQQKNCVEYLEIIDELTQTSDQEMSESESEDVEDEDQKMIVDVFIPEPLLDELGNPQQAVTDVEEEVNDNPTDIGPLLIQMEHYLSGSRVGSSSNSSSFKKARKGNHDFWSNSCPNTVKVKTEAQMETQYAESASVFALTIAQGQ